MFDFSVLELSESLSFFIRTKARFIAPLILGISLMMYIGPYATIAFLSTSLCDLIDLAIKWIIYPLIVTLIITLIVTLIIIIFYILMYIGILLIVGVFSCPDEKSFSPWLENMIKNISDLDQESHKPVSTGYMLTDIWNKTENYCVNFYFNKIILRSTKPKFFHLGFLRIAICSFGEEKI